MGPSSIVIAPDVLRTFDTSTLSGSYQAVGNPLSFSTRIAKFTNTSNAFVTISWNGSSDAEAFPANSFFVVDVSANAEVNKIYEIPIGTQFYIKGATPGVGLFYISTYYGR